jgi:phage gp46-like protein
MAKDIALGNRSAATGRYNFVRGDDGDVLFDSTEAHAVMTSVIEHKRFYWADSNHGSDLHTLKHLSSRTPSEAEAVVLDGLKPIEDANLIDGKQTTVTATRARGSSVGRLDIDIGWETPAGNKGSGKAGL